MTSAVSFSQPNAASMIVALPFDYGVIPLKSLIFATALVACSSSPTQASSVGSMRMNAGSVGMSVIARQQDVDPSMVDTLDEIKRFSGLTWGQLAEILGVSRQAIHSWASGAVVRVANVSRVDELLQRVREVSHLPAFKVRDILLGRSTTPLANTLEIKGDPPILVSDNTPFEHQLELKSAKTKVRRG